MPLTLLLLALLPLTLLLLALLLLALLPLTLLPLTLLLLTLLPLTLLLLALMSEAPPVYLSCFSLKHWSRYVSTHSGSAIPLLQEGRALRS